MFDKYVAFVDFNFYRGASNEIVIKEIAAIGLDGKYGLHYTFKEPYSAKYLSSKQLYSAQWVEDNMGLVPWSEGNVSYNELNRKWKELFENLRKNAIILVKGSEKYAYLKNKVDEVTRFREKDFKIYNIEDRLRTPTIRILKQKYAFLNRITRCKTHPDTCALTTAIVLKEHFQNSYSFHKRNLCEFFSQPFAGCMLCEYFSGSRAEKLSQQQQQLGLVPKKKRVNFYLGECGKETSSSSSPQPPPSPSHTTRSCTEDWGYYSVDNDDDNNNVNNNNNNVEENVGVDEVDDVNYDDEEIEIIFEDNEVEEEE